MKWFMDYLRAKAPAAIVAIALALGGQVTTSWLQLRDIASEQLRMKQEYQELKQKTEANGRMAEGVARLDGTMQRVLEELRQLRADVREDRKNHR